MSWTVFGGARPAVHLNVVESLHNIKTIPMFTAVKWAGPWQGMLGSAAQPSTWKFLKWLHNILIKKVLQHRRRNWAVFGGARPSLKFECFWKASRHPDEKLTQHRDLSWTVFGGARPAVHLNVVESLHNIKKKTLFNAVKWARPWQGMLGSAAQPSTWIFLNRLHNTQTKRFFNTVNKLGPCLGEHDPSKLSNVFKKLHAIRTKSWLNTVNWAGPCLGDHDQPFIWTLLKVCITSKPYPCLPPWNELGRDRGCWGAWPSSQLESFWNGCITSKQKGFATRWKELGRV